MRKFLTVAVYIGIGVIAIGALGNMVAPAEPEDIIAPHPVLVMRDMNEIRFTNDGPVTLKDCRVTIDGGFWATLPELPGLQRAALMRAQFSADIPRDEFYSRTRRSMEMWCSMADGYGGEQRVRVILK